MAESKGALIAKSVQKHAGRAKEKLLQNLGKVDRTLDDIFEEHLQNFNRQHQQATRLQKEFNNYIRCIRAVQTASKSLMEAITEVYESSWSGHDLLYVQAQNMEMLWQDFSHKLGDQVLIPINTYTNQFPEVRKKIEKRGRKLVDYDSQRHSFQNLQANAAKRRDDVKITKGREQLEEAKRTYEVLNSELHDELPALHDSRVLFYVHNLQTLFSSEQLFHAESSKVFAELEAITDKLATDSQRGGYRKHAANGSATLQTPSPALNGDSPPDSPIASNTPNTTNTPKTSNTPTPDAPARRDHSSPPDSPVKGGYSVNTVNSVNSVNSVNAVNAVNDVNSVNANTNANEDKKVEELYDIPVGAEIENVNNNVEEKRQVEDEKEKVIEKKETETPPKTDEVYDIPVGHDPPPPPGRPASPPAGPPAGPLASPPGPLASPPGPPTDRSAAGATLAPGAQYRVRATYRYTREDSDELSFDVGDVIRVVDYDDPDEQEEGWLMGIKETTNEKGMFPANFTRPI